MDLTQVVLFVKDVPRMQRFYEGMLGLRVVSAEEGFVRLDAGGCRLALHALPQEPEVSDPPIPREDSWIKLGFHVDDVSATRAKLVAAGVRMREVHVWSGVSFCDGVDPEGNVFQITTR
jgi:catechol 2,3-dioxygenase-like lactoylglutathione lyase family enzyme